MANNSAPRDANYSPELAGLSPGNGWAAVQLGATTGTDSATGNPYAPQITQSNVTGAADANAGASVSTASVLKYNGATWDRERIITKFVQIKAQAVTASTPVDVYTPTTGKKFRILGYDLGLSVAGSILLEDTTGTEVLRTGTMAANTGKSSGPMGLGILSTAANNHLFIDVTASGTVNGWIGICEE